MSRGKPVVLETRTFSDQKTATAFFKEMLGRYRPCERVSEVDALHLAALLKRHAEYEKKKGSGISHFEVMSADYGTHCFRVIRTDGTGEDFSYLHCISGRSKG